MNLPRLKSPLEPGEFDLTPVLRARYGNQLREEIVLIRLFAEDRNLVLRLDVAGQTEPQFISFSEVIFVPDDEPVSVADHLFEHFPHPAPYQLAHEESRQAWLLALLPHLLETFEALEVANDLHLFTPRTMDLLARLEKRQHDYKAPLYEEIHHFRQGVDFFRNCTEKLAQHFHREIRTRLTDKLANRLRRQPAFGILSSELKTYWDEIGVIAEEGSDNLLYWTLMDELDAIAVAALHELPEEEQFVLWVGGGEGIGWFDTYGHDDYPTGMSKADIDLAEMAVDIRNELLGEAMDTLSQEARDYLGY